MRTCIPIAESLVSKITHLVWSKILRDFVRSALADLKHLFKGMMHARIHICVAKSLLSKIAHLVWL